jgi:hypothetical protein
MRQRLILHFGDDGGTAPDRNQRQRCKSYKEPQEAPAICVHFLSVQTKIPLGGFVLFANQHRVFVCDLGAILAAACGAVFNGIPPYDLWEHPPAIGKIPPHGSDAGSYLVGEVFGARSIILVKDVDGLYTADPKTGPRAELIPEIGAADLLRMKMQTLPIEPTVLQLLLRAKLAKSIRIINGLKPGNLTRALAGEPRGTLITS